MREKSIIFESLYFMEWMIGVKEFEMFLRIVRVVRGLDPLEFVEVVLKGRTIFIGIWFFSD